MDKDKLIKRLMATFLGELEEHVGALNRDLLAMEKDPNGQSRAEVLKTLFRTAHSLKGAARSVNVTLLEDACHRLEEILSGVRDGRVALRPELFSLLFETADAIEEAGMRLREEADLAGSPLSGLLSRLDSAAVGDASAPSPTPTASAKPTPRPRGRGHADRQPDQAPPVKAEPAPPPGPAEESPSPSSHGGGHIEDGPRPSPPAIRRPANSSTIAAPAAPGPAAAESPIEIGARASFVRIPAEKLDALLTSCGELLVARRALERQVESLDLLRETVGRWQSEWKAVEKPIRTILDEDEDDAHDAASSRDVVGRLHRLPHRAAVTLGRVGDNFRHMEVQLEEFAVGMAGTDRRLAQAAGLIDEEVRRVRMLPFAEACMGLERMVRDLAHVVGKDVELVIEGGDVELDRSILEGLKDPLYHLVRNSVDHGIETPEGRRLAGKPSQARVTVAAALHGTQVEVVVADDGRGFDLDALREQVRRKGLPEPADDRDLAHMVFLPGFSTSRIITNISGRGVGLDVVKSRVESLHGTIDLAFTAGRGTRFTLALPLTLTTLRAMLIRAGGQTFALATTNVHKLVRIGPENFRSVEGREVVILDPPVLGGAPLPVVSLAETIGLPDEGSKGLTAKTPGLIVTTGEKRMVFVVDELLAEQEVVVKNLGARIRRVRNISGATILPSGQIALVLNAAHLVRTAMMRAPGSSLATARPASPSKAPKKRRRVLVVDDSVTTRTLEKSILEAAGFEVLTAVDGEAGWHLLLEQGADLLVSDVEMPRMDGFALTETVRKSKKFAELPVILFTSRGSEQDKARGIEVGADAYIVKGDFDQKDLVETIAQLL